MDVDKQIQILQMAYAGALADAVLQFSKEGVLENITRHKQQEQIHTSKMQAMQFGITKPEEVFLKLSEIFGCARWDIINNPTGGFIAQTNSCKLCAIAKKIGAPMPCYLYCLNPMEGIVKSLKSNAVYKVDETLWDGNKCSITVS